jgi:hypothetical protein
VQCVADANCGGGRVCTNNRCTCPSGQLNCGGQCIDPLTDVQNCGACGNTCTGASASCTGGSCQCGAGLTLCGGGGGGFAQCRDLSSDPRSCGTCGHACGDREACNAGKCVCREGLTLCNGQCVDTSSDPLHCGGCDAAKACATGQACQAGACVAGGQSGCKNPTPDACTVGNRVACVDRKTDPLNCGGCQNACATTEVCVDGNCERYRPATGCNTCPCNAVCTAIAGQGTDVACCGSQSGSTQPICVIDVTTCPM